jgi:hypothetical protein
MGISLNIDKLRKAQAKSSLAKSNGQGLLMHSWHEVAYKLIKINLLF